jgi:putative membrane protein insertion efficiency factor
MNCFQRLLLSSLRLYQLVLSPVLAVLFGPSGLGCRYQPSCSQYAIEAVRLHGARRGSWLAARRLCRCHPWGGCGEDPVPPLSEFARPPKLFLKHGS